MIALGSVAPPFGCSAWSNGRVRRLGWPALHTGTLLLLFDAQAARQRRALCVLNQAAHRLSDAARLAVVCHGPLHVVERWAQATLARHEPLVLTVILDPEDHLAALYGLVSADGTARWGQFIIDGAAVVRQAQVCRCHVPPDADELVREARAIAASSARDGTLDPCPFEEQQ
jgi:hypothetical protein